MDQNALIGLNIKLLREKMGISQLDLGTYLGISRELISYYESGKRNIPTDVINKTAQLLGVDEFDLFEKDPEQQTANTALAFRANELHPEDLTSIANFRKIVRNYLKMQKVIADE